MWCLPASVVTSIDGAALSTTPLMQRRASLIIWLTLTRAAWLARKNSSFISIADADALNAAATAVSSIAVIARLISTSTRLRPARRLATADFGRNAKLGMRNAE